VAENPPDKSARELLFFRAEFKIMHCVWGGSLLVLTGHGSLTRLLSGVARIWSVDRLAKRKLAGAVRRCAAPPSLKQF
jgi:hypothetical protein